MEDERIEAVRNWLEPKLMRDIQVFLKFANFYWRFIQDFSKIAGPLTLMLKTTQSAKNLSLSMAEDAEVDSIGNVDCKNKIVKKSPLISQNSNRAMGYLTPQARLTFT